MREGKRNNQMPTTINGGTALARAVALHLEGKGREALKELDRAVESGDPAREVYAAKGHIQFELEMFDDSVKSYESLLSIDPDSTSAYFISPSAEKLGRWNDAAVNFSGRSRATPAGSTPGSASASPASHAHAEKALESLRSARQDAHR